MKTLYLENKIYGNRPDLTPSKNKFENILFAGFFIIYGTLLIYTTNKINIAEDEIYTLNTSSNTFFKLIHQSYYFEYQPPLYFLVLSWWRSLSSGIFFTKLFSIFCTGISAYFFYKIVAQLSSKSISKWMVIIFLLNPFTVWAALEIRLYAFLMMLSILAIYYFFRFYFENNKKALIIFSIISLFGIYTQYFFSFLIIAFGILESISGNRKALYQYIFFLFPVVLLSLPNLLFIPVGVASQEARVDPFSIIHKIIYTPRNLFLSINEVPGVWLNRIARFIIYVPLIVAFIIHYFKSNSERKRMIKIYNIILLLVIIIVILYCIGFAITKVGYDKKYQTVAFPLYILLFTIVWIYPTIIKNIIFGYISVYFTIILIAQYINPVKTYDYKTVASFLQSIEKNNEPIFAYRAVLAIPLKYYYHSKNQIYPLPYPVDFNSNYRFSIQDTFQLRKSTLPHLDKSKSFFVVSDTTKYEGLLNMNRSMVSNYLDLHYQKTMDTFLLGNGKGRCLRIRRYELK